MSSAAEDNESGGAVERRSPQAGRRSSLPLEPVAPRKVDFPAPPRLPQFPALKEGLARWPWRLLSFLAAVVLPTAIAAIYFLTIASSQYVSEIRFSVRHADPLRTDPTLVSGSASASVAVAMLESQEVVQYVRSREMVDQIEKQIDLRSVYAAHGIDRFARLDPSVSVEELTKYWNGMVDPFFDLSTGLITVSVRAFRPADAQAIAAAILSLSEKLVNDLSERARSDTLNYAEKAVSDAEKRLRAAEIAILDYRNQHNMLDPTLESKSSTELEARVTGELMNARVRYATMQSQLRPGAPALNLLQSQIAALQGQLDQLHATMARPNAAAGGKGGQTLSTVLTGYENLQVEQNLAGKTYEAALLSEQKAREQADRQQIYLEAFVQPALAQEPLYPQRGRSILVVFLVSFAVWCLGSLLYHAISDHL